MCYLSVVDMKVSYPPVPLTEQMFVRKAYQYPFTESLKAEFRQDKFPTSDDGSCIRDS